MADMKWKPDAEIRVRIENGTAVLSANRDGLLSLADHLCALAESSPGSHVHYDAYNSLEEGSSELVIERI